MMHAVSMADRVETINTSFAASMVGVPLANGRSFDL